MAVAQSERAANFIRGQGGVQSVRGARVNRVRARNVRAAKPQEQLVPQRPNVVRQQGSRFGKATGNDYVKFFGTRENTKRLRLAVNNLKNLLVEGFMAAKMLRVSIGNIINQLKGLGGKGGRGFGLIGIIAAIVVAIGALIGPKIKEAYDFIVTQATEMFKTVKGWLRAADEKIQELYRNLQGMWDTVRGWIKSTTDTLRSIPMIGNAIPDIDLPALPDYNGLDFLKDDLPAGNEPSAPGSSSASGGIESLFQSIMGSIGLQGNKIAKSLGLPALFPEQQSQSNQATQTQSATTTSSGASGGSQSQMEVAQTLVTEFKNQGLSSEGAKLATAEIGRENSLNVNTILGTHDDRGTTAYGAISWQGGREKVLFDELRARGIEPTVEGLRNSGDEGIRANAAAMIKEMSSGTEHRPELLRLLKKETLSDAEKDKVRQLMKDRYFRYDPTIPIQRSREWYDRINSFGLQSALPIQAPIAAAPQQQSSVPSSRGPHISAVNLGGTPQAPRRPQSPITPAGNTGATPTLAFFAPSNPDASNIYTKHLLGVIG